MTAAVTRWWLIRHAPVINPERLIYGQRDVLADTSNEADFAGLAQTVPRRAVWLETPLQRTRATAAAILDAGDFHSEIPRPTPIVVPDLIEQNFGDWQGISHQQLCDSRKGEDHPFWLAPALERPPGGESFMELVARVAIAMLDQSARHVGQDIVAVCHGGTIRGALAVALGLDPERALAFRIDNLSLTRIDRLELDGRPPAWRVEAVNLPPGAGATTRASAVA
ncbi:MAG: histidine phosphatase family protein [Azospirillaceae bacterium]|nr:histidine phosphatase family protein [Azospirillaceae bacterium]